MRRVLFSVCLECYSPSAVGQGWVLSRCSKVFEGQAGPIQITGSGWPYFLQISICQLYFNAGLCLKCQAWRFSADRHSKTPQNNSAVISPLISYFAEKTGIRYAPRNGATQSLTMWELLAWEQRRMLCLGANEKYWQCRELMIDHGAALWATGGDNDCLDVLSHLTPLE